MTVRYARTNPDSGDQLIGPFARGMVIDDVDNQHLVHFVLRCDGLDTILKPTFGVSTMILAADVVRLRMLFRTRLPSKHSKSGNPMFGNSLPV